MVARRRRRRIRDPVELFRRIYLTEGLRELLDRAVRRVGRMATPARAWRAGPDHAPVVVQASRWGSIISAAWSFMLAARAHGLGTVWTTFHLRHEREAAKLLGIPFDEVMQAALIPVAYTVGTDFRPAARTPLDTIVQWDRW
jgi:nitroreductase